MLRRKKVKYPKFNQKFELEVRAILFVWHLIFFLYLASYLSLLSKKNTTRRAHTQLHTYMTSVSNGSVITPLKEASSWFPIVIDLLVVLFVAILYNFHHFHELFAFVAIIFLAVMAVIVMKLFADTQTLDVVALLCCYELWLIRGTILRPSAASDLNAISNEKVGLVTSFMMVILVLMTYVNPMLLMGSHNNSRRMCVVGTYVFLTLFPHTCSLSYSLHGFQMLLRALVFTVLWFMQDYTYAIPLSIRALKRYGSGANRLSTASVSQHHQNSLSRLWTRRWWMCQLTRSEYHVIVLMRSTWVLFTHDVFVFFVVIVIVAWMIEAGHIRVPTMNNTGVAQSLSSFSPSSSSSPSPLSGGHCAIDDIESNTGDAKNDDTDDSGGSDTDSGDDGELPRTSRASTTPALTNGPHRRHKPMPVLPANMNGERQLVSVDQTNVEVFLKRVMDDSIRSHLEPIREELKTLRSVKSAPPPPLPSSPPSPMPSIAAVAVAAPSPPPSQPSHPQPTSLVQTNFTQSSFDTPVSAISTQQQQQQQPSPSPHLANLKPARPAPAKVTTLKRPPPPTSTVDTATMFTASSRSTITAGYSRLPFMSDVSSSPVSPFVPAGVTTSNFRTLYGTDRTSATNTTSTTLANIPPTPSRTPLPSSNAKLKGTASSINNNTNTNNSSNNNNSSSSTLSQSGKALVQY